MTAGGTGITPMFQVIQAAVLNNDDVDITLLFGNVSEDDILLKKELDAFAEANPSRFRVIYIIDSAKNPDKWTGHTGYITKELVQK